MAPDTCRMFAMTRMQHWLTWPLPMIPKPRHQSGGLRKKQAVRYARAAVEAGETLRGLICDEGKMRACLAKEYRHTIRQATEDTNWKRFKRYWKKMPERDNATTQSPTARPHH